MTEAELQRIETTAAICTAAPRPDALALCAEVRRLRAELQRLQDAICRQIEQLDELISHPQSLVLLAVRNRLVYALTAPADSPPRDDV